MSTHGAFISQRPPAGRIRFIPHLVALVSFGLCADTAHADLSELFAPPTADEVAAVEADWAARNPVVEGWMVEAEGVSPEGYCIKVVSHVVDGYRHYGAVRYPLEYEPGTGGCFAVLISCHGGSRGIGLQSFNTFDEMVSTNGTKENYIILLPSYRGESLNAGPLGQYLSEGEPSPGDRDADDVIAMLDGVLANIPEADVRRVVVYGASRGGEVAQHVGIREPRVRTAVSLFTACDCFLPSLQEKAENILYHGAPSHGVIRSIMAEVVYPWYEGEITTAEGRYQLLLRSPLYFAHRYAQPWPRFQLHHGALDLATSVEHSDRLDDLLTGLGASAPGYEYFRYPEGTHTIGSLPGAPERIAHLLCDVMELNPGDLNCDGAVDFGDIHGFWLALKFGESTYVEHYPECNWFNADCNNDRQVNFYDIVQFKVLLGIN